MKHKEYIDNLGDYYRVILDDKINDINFTFLNDKIVYVTNESKDNIIRSSYNTNIYVACFTTAHDRLRLYEVMKKLDESVCYVDTDSIIYKL